MSPRSQLPNCRHGLAICLFLSAGHGADSGLQVLFADEARLDDCGFPLSDATRGSTWVKDLPPCAQKHTRSTFILGSDGDDPIKGDSGNNYLEGGNGNDTFRLGGGYNIVLGGEGDDTIDLQRKLSHSEIAWDGETLYLRDKAGDITLAKDVENIQSCENLLLLFNQQVTHRATDAGLKSGNKLTDYASSVSGGTGNDVLLGKHGDWLFGLDGDDTLIGRGNNTFVGGAGDDAFFSAGKNNTFLFSGDFDNDNLYNLQKSDKLVFLNVEGATHGNFRDYATQQGTDVVLNMGNNSVTLMGVNMEMLTHDMLVMA